MVKMVNTLLKTINTSQVKTINTNRNPYAVERTRGRAWMTRRAKWLRDHPLCVVCQAQGYVQVAQELDHIVPLADGGADDESNYQSLCVECHKAKTASENSARGRGHPKSGA